MQYVSGECAIQLVKLTCCFMILIVSRAKHSGMVKHELTRKRLVPTFDMIVKIGEEDAIPFREWVC